MGNLENERVELWKFILNAQVSIHGLWVIGVISIQYLAKVRGIEALVLKGPCEVLEFSCSAAVSKCLFALFAMSIFYAGLIISLLLIIIFCACEFVGVY